MEDRKARLAALRAKAGRNAKETTDDSSEGDSQKEPNKEPVLQVVTLANNGPTGILPPLKKKQRGSEDKKAESVLVKALRQAQAEAKTSAISGGVEDAAPKKINADLKREIQPKLDKLERRTQKAIVSLLRERLEHEAAAEIDE